MSASPLHGPDRGPPAPAAPRAQHAPHACSDLLEVRGVGKSFPGVVALADVQLRLRSGSVHALMGENGAGKSTLMKIIAGVHAPDTGEIRLRGRPVTLRSPLDALRQGIAMIHQELNLMPSMTVAENIWIGREPVSRLGLVDHRQLRQRTQALFERLAIDMDPDSEVRTLSVASRQMVEIAKAVSFDSEVLIMDEPTSALTDREVEHLFRIIGHLRGQGKGIVYITHKINELFEIADEFSVFRDGRYIGTHASADVTRDDIIRMMVGREITRMFPKQDVALGDVVLSVDGLGVEGVFHGLRFELRAGEILGVAGLVGSGRSNLAEALFGVVPATCGEIRIGGEPVRITSPAQAMRLGMAFLTEDRKDTGCFMGLDLLANMEVALLHERHVRWGLVAHAAVARECEDMARTLQVRSPGLHEDIRNLSGGNQQKVLIGRWLLTRPRILILDEPTRGIDVGAKAEIHRLVGALAAQGTAVLMVSSEMPEVLGMSDRILVRHEGRMTGIVERRDADQVRIMELASR